MYRYITIISSVIALMYHYITIISSVIPLYIATLQLYHQIWHCVSLHYNYIISYYTYKQGGGIMHT